MKRQLLGEAGPLQGPPNLACAAVRNASRQMHPAMPTLGVTHGLAVHTPPAFEVGPYLMVLLVWTKRGCGRRPGGGLGRRCWERREAKQRVYLDSNQTQSFLAVCT